ncbi:MAG: hypothetical protein D3919_10075 [Candidatus Electrothrix sp. AW5]|nr:hypothetical protein [Candidatus Electrothrix gigas]
MRTAILENGGAFSNEELHAMDINNDGSLDTADLIIYVRQNNSDAAVSFLVSESIVNEGEDSLSLAVEYTEDYSGSLRYIVEGTAVSGQDFQTLSGSLPVSSRLEHITLNFIDDLEAEDVESIRITLLPDIDYHIGAAQQHTVYLYDNDAVWQGNLHIDGMLTGFELLLAQSGSDYTASVSSDGSDGLPAGTWPTSLSVSQDSFSLMLGPVTLEPEDTLLTAQFDRTILLTAQSDNAMHTFDLNALIQGDMIEEIDASKAQFSRLGNRAVTGSFTLVKNPSFVPAAESSLENLK